MPRNPEVPRHHHTRTPPGRPRNARPTRAATSKIPYGPARPTTRKPPKPPTIPRSPPRETPPRHRSLPPTRHRAQHTTAPPHPAHHRTRAAAPSATRSRRAITPPHPARHRTLRTGRRRRRVHGDRAVVQRGQRRPDPHRRTRTAHPDSRAAPHLHAQHPAITAPRNIAAPSTNCTPRSPLTAVSTARVSPSPTYGDISHDADWAKSGHSARNSANKCNHAVYARQKHYDHCL